MHTILVELPGKTLTPATCLRRALGMRGTAVWISWRSRLICCRDAATPRSAVIPFFSLASRASALDL